MKKIYLLLVSILMLGAAETNAQCSASFQYFSNNLTVQFQDSSFVPQGAVMMYDWYFGDGNFSSQQSPTHTYAQAGTYFVCLTIFDTLRNCSDSTCFNVTVTSSQPQPCNTTYTYNVNPNNVVSFFSSVTGGTAPFSYSWNFGTSFPGGGSSNQANPTFSYNSPGVYGVTLTTISATGDSCIYYDTVYVNNCNANFIARAGSNGAVSFTNLSNPNNSSVAFNWNFGDGSSNVGTTNPTHTYTAAGTYIVTLSMYDSLRNCNATYSDSVVVTIGSPSSCNASYTIALDSSAAFQVILYNTSSNFASHTYSWNFGDGTTGSGRTPLHQYQSFGSYVVCLTITDTILNCTSTFCDTVGMDTLGNLKAGFGLTVQDPIAVSIEEEVDELSALRAFPNPASTNISLDLRKLSNTVNMKVMDISGRTVIDRKNTATGNIERLDISELHNGIYFILIDNGENQKVEKFIKSE